MRKGSMPLGALLCCVIASMVVGPVHAGKKKTTKQPAEAPKAAEVEKPDLSNRFYMTQNGKQMSAEDFDAWMKSRGYRVATGGSSKAGGGDAIAPENESK